MSIALQSFAIDAGELLQHVSRVGYRGEPLYYGRDGINRYDAPMRDYGVLYPSRNNFPSESIALFECAKEKIQVIKDIDLIEHVDWPRFVADYRIGVELDPGPAGPHPEAS
ncbi:MAG: hypothetical protein ACRYHA_01580 [Janthinobacterium lividum]